ncbi:MAG TPA: ribosome biogenesis GTP-binding protein YihA/YsxC [Rhizomicrobium sp.]|jgi:GTP-binding protein|nr:ribosome biogenesis GTP-binding protein YihA/YsxC [Rhizomicrobium sp.]HWA70051.1 ribosome biogenesis GTP-binding protein YihA/YsxC [Rhizomicrobium sp.]
MTDPQAEEAARILFAGPCDFIWGATSADALPPEKYDEVAFVGRSNAGKSSLVNALTGRKSLARVSQTPGATRQINFFNLAERLILVDLPGYGFAKRSKTESDAWQEMIFAYLRRRSRLRRVALLIDSRRGVMDSDRQVMDLLDQTAVSYGLVLTKADELKPAGREAARLAAGEEAAKHTAALAEVQLTSALTGDGIPALRTHLADLAR